MIILRMFPCNLFLCQYYLSFFLDEFSPGNVWSALIHFKNNVGYLNEKLQYKFAASSWERQWCTYTFQLTYYRFLISGGKSRAIYNLLVLSLSLIAFQ